MKKILLMATAVSLLALAGCANKTTTDQSAAMASSDNSAAQTTAMPAKSKHHDYKGETK